MLSEKERLILERAVEALKGDFVSASLERRMRMQSAAELEKWLAVDNLMQQAADGEISEAELQARMPR